MLRKVRSPPIILGIVTTNQTPRETPYPAPALHIFHEGLGCLVPVPGVHVQHDSQKIGKNAGLTAILDQRDDLEDSLLHRVLAERVYLAQERDRDGFDG